jgi:hypothetical protein
MKITFSVIRDLPELQQREHQMNVLAVPELVFCVHRKPFDLVAAGPASAAQFLDQTDKFAQTHQNCTQQINTPRCE